MDYFSEIAGHPDIQEALNFLRDEEFYPDRLQGTLAKASGKSEELQKLAKEGPTFFQYYPTLWRAEMVNWFYLHPDFAASVWRQFLYCRTQRERLIPVLAQTKKPSKFKQLLRKLHLSKLTIGPHNKFLSKLGLDSGASEKEIQKRLESFDLRQIENLEELSRTLDVRLEGPEFIEKLLECRSWKRYFWGLFPPNPTIKQIAELISDRERVHKLAKEGETPVPFAMVHENELGQVSPPKQTTPPADSSKVAKTSSQSNPSPARGDEVNGSPMRRALYNPLLGLAFSGGGIRSATFNLGVLQALAKQNILRSCHYLSTVSGGGYIGSWFHAWARRISLIQAAGGAAPDFRELQKQMHDEMRIRLSPVRTPNPLDSRVRPIRYLREFSNYLTPKTGFLSADTWTMVAIYVRNLLLNLLVLLPAIAVVLLIPRLVFRATCFIFAKGRGPWLVPSLITLCMGVATAVLIANLRRASPRKTSTEEQRSGITPENRIRWFARPLFIQIGVVLPFLIGAWLTGLSYWLWIAGSANSNLGLKHWEDSWPQWLQVLPVPDHYWSAALATGIVFLLYFTVIHLAGRFYVCWGAKRNVAYLNLAIATLGASAAAGMIFWLLGKILSSFQQPWMVLTYGIPITLAAYSCIVVMQLGLLGTKFPDEQREWWSRLRAWTMIYSLGWAALFTMAIFVPCWIESATNNQKSMKGAWSAFIVWVLSSIFGVKAGQTTPASGQEKSAAKKEESALQTPSLGDRGKRLIALVAPYIFMIGLLALTAFVIEKLLSLWLGGSASDSWARISAYSGGKLLLAVGMLAAVSIFISWRIGVNEFSMHHFYKNRLVRCYLGASRWNTRKANWFTGFDSADDLFLSLFDNDTDDAHWRNRQVISDPFDANDAKYPGPYPILNATLNLVAGQDMAWQERKAASFVFTPKYCGYDVDRAVLTKRKTRYWPEAYAPTRCYVNYGVGPMLGTAMAISGAAANPNMGKVTSPASAFLMTIFNVRLGWWLPNPRVKTIFGWDRSGPRLGLTYTGIELFGLTNDEKKFINVSDGGHFENLAVYELIRRGVRYIIASDAGQDGAFNLEDLGNLVRKCRVDFGVEIEICTDQIRDRSQKGWSNAHCVVGKIHYLGVPKHDAQGNIILDINGEPKHEEGLLIYLKPSITGDESFDIQEYYRRVAEFPHESTADQWFNESQFESYRKLGMHIAEIAFARYPDKVGNIEDLFESLERFWHPPNPKVAEHSTDHAEEYTRIMELIRSSEELQFLDPTLFSGIEANGLMSNQRNEFYVCNALIQLIENVYADLELEQNYQHPHVIGWMKIFRRWAKAKPFERTWEISKSTYATRFQRFYEDRLINGSGD